jgi:hypothetical protein
MERELQENLRRRHCRRYEYELFAIYWPRPRPPPPTVVAASQVTAKCRDAGWRWMVFMCKRTLRCLYREVATSQQGDWYVWSLGRGSMLSHVPHRSSALNPNPAHTYTRDICPPSRWHTRPSHTHGLRVCAMLTLECSKEEVNKTNLLLRCQTRGECGGANVLPL